MAQTVLVTGGSGFVAGWCMVELLRRGYDVRATLRSLSKEGAVREAVASAAGSTDRLSFFTADLLSDAGWHDALKGCDYVLHVASPLGGGTSKTADELVRPARDGTLRVLRAATKAGVKRVVMTSSCAAVTPAIMEVDSVSDETLWSDPVAQQNDHYRLSKTMAERAAWEFMDTHGGSTTFVSVLPSAIFGPVLTMDSLGSVQFIQRLIDGRMPRVPRIGLNIVDVRDVAEAHILAMTRPEAAGQRFIANGDFMWMKEVAAVLRARLGERGAKVPTKELPDIVVKVGAAVSPALRTLRPLLRRSHRFSSAKIRRVLGWASRPATETVVECAESLVSGSTPLI
jgi:nucleoside-diphosphate-sugar epimerase